MNHNYPVITPRLGKLLTVVLLLFALMAVNSVYLAAITVLESVTGGLYQDYFYLLMFLVHLALGLLIILPVILFATAHMRRALNRPNRDAIRAGIALFISALLVLLSGLLLTRFEFFELNDPDIRRIGYWVHVITPLAVVWLFILHRLAGPPIHWRSGRHWLLLAIGFAAVMVLLQAGLLHHDDSGPGTAFAPSRAVLAGSKVIPPEHLMTDDECANCHADIASTHELSVHRFSSMNNPAYKFSVEETRQVVLSRDGNVQVSRFCAACHDPVPLFSGRFDRADFDMDNDPTGQVGITCMSCHAITRINSTRGNGDYTIIDPPRYPFANSDSGLLAYLNHLLIKAKPDFHKKTLLKPLHRSAEFCSTCHKASLTQEVNHYRWLRGQDHYDSFLQSGVSGHRVDSFYYPPEAVSRCSECHMPLEASADPAARDFDDSGQRSIHSHLFPAANTGVAHMLGLPGEVIKAHQARLADVTRIDIFGIKEDGRIDGRLHAPLDRKQPLLQPGQRYLLEIVVRTTGVGHHLTQGTADSNQLWVEVTASSDGETFGHSGAMNASGKVDPWSWFANAYVLDRNGKRIDRRNAQDIFVPLYNHQIPPGAAAVVHYLLEVPEQASGSITLEARLNYRKFDSTYLRYILGDDYVCNDLPVTVLASDRISLPVTVQPSPSVQKDQSITDAERWNDYGIGLLRSGHTGAGKGELRQAEQAFRQVEQQGRGDGALNLARVYFREGRLDEATQALLRAGQEGSPAAPWTIAWFSALVDRQNGHLQEAISTLEAIVDNRFADARARGFDFSKDVRLLNELGRSLYERARQLHGQNRQQARQELLERARSRFEQTLAVDPENASAHHNLSLVYQQQGKLAQAEMHRRLHQQYRPDDAAIEQAVSLHRSENPAADHAASGVAIYRLEQADGYSSPAHRTPSACSGK
jgi:tetratricopeptide (TPR) repeat protein